MSRRGRAIVFGVAALFAAVAAAAIADGYGDSVARGYGELRPVVVARDALRVGRPIDSGTARVRLELRRIPAPFIPPGALASAAEALGLAPAAPIPAGSYLLAQQLRPPREAGAPEFGGGRHAVEIAVSGAEALLLTGAPPAGARVDVLVTTEPGAGGSGRTYVAAAAVPLLALRAGTGATEAEGTAAATLALTRRQALRLIAAESFARRVTLLAGG